VALSRGELKRRSARQKAAAAQWADDGEPPLDTRPAGYTPKGDIVPIEGYEMRLFRRSDVLPPRFASCHIVFFRKKAWCTTESPSRSEASLAIATAPNAPVEHPTRLPSPSTGKRVPHDDVCVGWTRTVVVPEDLSQLAITDHD
jgi:hypothetical protein